MLRRTKVSSIKHNSTQADAEYEALREKIAEWERGERQYPQAVQDYKDLCVELKRTQFDLANVCTLLEKAEEALMWTNTCPRNFDRVEPTIAAIKQWKEQTR
jgi:hypothetical protein